MLQPPDTGHNFRFFNDSLGAKIIGGAGELRREFHGGGLDHDVVKEFGQGLDQIGGIGDAKLALGPHKLLENLCGDLPANIQGPHYHPMLIVFIIKRSERGRVEGDGARELRSALAEESAFQELGFVAGRVRVWVLLEVARVRVGEVGEALEEEGGGLGVVVPKREVLGVMVMGLWGSVETREGVEFGDGVCVLMEVNVRVVLVMVEREWSEEIGRAHV